MNSLKKALDQDPKATEKLLTDMMSTKPDPLLGEFVWFDAEDESTWPKDQRAHLCLEVGNNLPVFGSDYVVLDWVEYGVFSGWLLHGDRYSIPIAGYYTKLPTPPKK